MNKEERRNAVYTWLLHKLRRKELVIADSQAFADEYAQALKRHPRFLKKER